MRPFAFALALLVVSPIAGRPASAATHAVSLRVLSDALTRCRLGAGCPPAVERLGGLSTVAGFVVDRTGDVVLFGDADTDRAALRTEDWLVALRSGFRRYVARENGKLVWSPLGCSIDPEPDVLVDLQRASAGRSLDAAIDRWTHVCARSQRVVVTGMPQRLHFARVLVTADYDLKRLVDGSDDLELPGLTSVVGLALQAIRQAGPAARAFALMNRFWFTIGQARLAIDTDAVELETLRVRLMTEEQMLGRHGRVVGTNTASPLADTFAQAFSMRWDEIAARRPVYAEMASLFRLAVLARAIAEEHAFERARLDPGVLLDSAALPEDDVPSGLPGRSRVVGFETETPTTRGILRSTVRLPSCGGVDLSVDLARAEVRRETSPALHALTRRILASRPTPDALQWSIDS